MLYDVVGYLPPAAIVTVIGAMPPPLDDFSVTVLMTAMRAMPTGAHRHIMLRVVAVYVPPIYQYLVAEPAGIGARLPDP